LKFKKVTSKNIDILYKLNKQLAIDENQKYLFTADKKEYKKAFLSNFPIVFGILIYKKNKPIGFIIYIKKFATYLAKEVLFIEDIYLPPKHQSKKNIKKIFKFINNLNYIRIELRVLKNYNLNKKLLKKLGFKKIKKWNTYRKEKT